MGILRGLGIFPELMTEFGNGIFGDLVGIVLWILLWIHVVFPLLNMLGMYRFLRDYSKFKAATVVVTGCGADTPSR